MHPKNPYNIPVDFKKLSAKFAELRPHCILKPNGKISYNFHSDEAIRVLTKVLLEEDFQLKVDIPRGNLVPRIPSRMNYLLLINDILQMNNITENVTGIDIGTGSSCIYALLGARKFGWRFIATDSNMNSIASAKQNVLNNELESLITVMEAEGSRFFPEIASTSQEIVFSMCNPPFFRETETEMRFSFEEEAVMTNVASDIRRAPPKSATTARKNELETEGGEVSFIIDMIEESLKISGNVRIFSSLIGKKKSISALKHRLDSIDNIRYSFSTLEQGKTHRWVLLWSFQDVWLDQTCNLIPVSKKDSESAMLLVENLLRDLRIIIDKCRDRTGEEIVIGKVITPYWSKRQINDNPGSPARKRSRF